MVGRTILQYQLVEKLGAGGMGEVYKAQDTRLNRFVAMKVLPASMSADPDRRRRFIQEAQASSALNHPNIITIYDIVSDGDTQYLVMEYLAGRTLLELIPKDGLRVPQVIEYAAQIAEALAAAHSAGIIHRDLKPANIMVTTSGLVKLLDFGLAKLVEEPDISGTAETVTRLQGPMTVEGTMMGTLNYMSPEQAEGRKLDPRSDIFSFGAVLYEMLTGRSAFAGPSPISILSAVLRDDVRPIVELTPDVPFELEQIVLKCLRKDPDQRFQSMQEVERALLALKRQSDSGALYNRPASILVPAGTAPQSHVAPRAQAARDASKARLIATIFIVVVVTIVGGGYFWSVVLHRSEPRPAQPAGVTQSADGTIDNDNIVAMVAAKVTPSLIISQIRASKTNFNLSADEVIRLSKAGVPAEVIEAMRNPRANPFPDQATAAPAAAPDAPVETRPPAPVAAPVVLGDGLPIRLTLASDVPDDAAEGDALRFNVAEDVRVDGSVVIAKGAPATGIIVDAAKKKILGFGGKMTFRFENVDAADGQQVPIRATQTAHRDGTSKRTVESGSKRPKGIAAEAGAEYVAYTDGEKTIAVKK